MLLCNNSMSCKLSNNGFNKVSKTFRKKITESYKKPLNEPRKAAFILMKNAIY